MKNLGRALLLLTLGLVLMSSAAMAQDALSMILPSPESSRVGSQLLFFYEDGTSLGPNNGARGKFVSYLTVTNTNITAAVTVHYQFYTIGTGTGCAELFDFTDSLSQGKTIVINPTAVQKGSTVIGSATDGRYLLTVTPVAAANIPSDLTAVAFNYLSGQQWTSDLTKGATAMVNAVARMAVDINGGLVAGPGVDNVLGVNGTTIFFQYFRPQTIAVNAFFAPSAVQQGTPFGNRLTMLSWTDQYTAPLYRIVAGATTLNSFVFDNNENAFSVPARNPACVTEWTIAPTAPGTASPGTGNWTDFLSPAADASVRTTGGWLRARVGTLAAHTSLMGWFGQTLDTYGGADLLLGIGRQVFTLAGAATTTTPIYTSSGTFNLLIINTTGTVN